MMNKKAADSPVLVFARYAAVAGGAAVLGGALALINDVYLFKPWVDLGWHRQVADWIIGIGLGDWIAGQWMLIWCHIPEWLIATILGIVSGISFRRRWLIVGLSCGLGFAFAGDFLCLITGDSFPWFGRFGLRVWVSILCWRTASVGLVVLLSFASSRMLSDHQHETAAEFGIDAESPRA